LRGTGVKITILHPGATATAFHARAGMGATAFGDNSWKNDSAEVARQGYEALKKGETSLIGGDAATQQARQESTRCSLKRDRRSVTRRWRARGSEPVSRLAGSKLQTTSTARGMSLPGINQNGTRTARAEKGQKKGRKWRRERNSSAISLVISSC
jgi:hypothetical protein